MTGNWGLYMGEKLLIVDDESDIVETTAQLLRARGYDIVTAFDGTKGLEKAKIEYPGLIILDIGMPVKDGYEICFELKRDKVTKGIPVIMLTAKGESEAIEKAKKSGADDYVVKPFNIQFLSSRINKLLAKKNEK